MAIVVYPLNNIDFTAEDVAIYNSTRTSGIYAGDDFAISLTGSDNTISIDVGMAWMHLSRFNGVAVALKTKTYVDMGLPNATYPRIDALVLQFDANKNGAELVSKQGTASSTPQPPAVSRTEALYELHLLHVRRNPGAASITAADVTDLRLNEQYCGLMADSVTRVDTGAIQAQINELLQRISEELADLEAGTAVELKKRSFFDTVVPASAFVADSTSEDYPYRAAISLSGVVSGMVPEVVFGLADAVSGNFAPVVEAYNGGVYIWAAEVPETSITIPTIICWREA